jgi:hypothetical protein
MRPFPRAEWEARAGWPFSPWAEMPPEIFWGANIHDSTGSNRPPFQTPTRWSLF